MGGGETNRQTAGPLAERPLQWGPGRELGTLPESPHGWHGRDPSSRYCCLHGLREQEAVVT